jgi:hypothetical protein
MDELALLKQFRLEDAAPNGAREHARQVLEASISHRRVRRRLVVAVAFVVAAILVGAAYGIVHELIIGSPAPPEVKQTLARLGHEADLIPQPHPGDPRVDEAKVAAVLDSPIGRVFLFSVPAKEGDELYGWVWVEGARVHGQPDMSGVGGTADETFWMMGNEPLNGKRQVFLFEGRAGNDVARASLVFSGGRRVELPLVDHWFLAEFDNQNPVDVVAYDKDGHVIPNGFHYREPQIPPTLPAPHASPHQVGPARELLTLQAESGERITLDVAPSSDGGSCMFVRSDRRPTTSGCANPTPLPDAIDVSPMQFGGAPGGVQLLVGQAGAWIAKLQLRYQDGRRVDVPLEEGWALYEVAKADYAEGRRPADLIGLDTSGKEIATKHLPWAVGTAG